MSYFMSRRRLLITAWIASSLGCAFGFSSRGLPGSCRSSDSSCFTPCQQQRKRQELRKRLAESSPAIRKFELAALEIPSSSVGDSGTSSSTAETTTTPVPWTFRGFDCYAEVTTINAKAGEESNSSPWDTLMSSLLPKTTTTSSSKAVTDIVLIHGFGCSTTYWRAAKAAFAQAGYTVHALDLMGQGQSAKPGRADGVEYSIDLWANLVDDYVQQLIIGKNRNGNKKGVVLMGNSLGSVVALSVATGDFLNATAPAAMNGNYKGLGLYNCGVGMNSRNLLKDPTLALWQVSVFAFLFDALDTLIFGNRPFITYLLQEVVTPELLSNALKGLYPNGPQRVDDILVQSFYQPSQDPGSPECLNQIYTNDAGRTPQELHQKYPAALQNMPIHVVWGTQDTVTPLAGPVGQFYRGLADGKNSPVSMVEVNAGHIPFDEVPDCNDSMLAWLKGLDDDETAS